MDWIVIIDDDTSNLKTAGTILSQHQMRVTALKSGRIALDYIRKNGFPDLILLDLAMPEMDGYETLRLLKHEMGPVNETPVVFLAEEDDPTQEIQAQEAGAVDLIRKPFDPDTLILRVREILEKHRQRALLAGSSDEDQAFCPDPGPELGTKLLDLETITAILEAKKDAPNSIWIGQSAFSSIYRFMIRYLDRYHSSAYRVLLTLKIRSELSPEEQAAVMDDFRQTIQSCLRNSDVMMECGIHQLFLLLPEIRDFDIQRVVARLLSRWRDSPSAKSGVITYECGPVRTSARTTLEPHPEGARRIAIVDDDKTNLLLAKSILSRQGMDVITFSSGSDLLARMSDLKPDLILLDMLMPDPDGMETFQLLKQQYGDETPPVIFLTANDDGALETRCLELGATDFIKKPFLPKVLVLRVTHTLELVQLQQHLSEAVARKTRENESLSLHVVQTLAEAIDAKDRYTNGHSSRVAAYSREIARRYGYTVKHQEEIYMMGLLHDVGKIGIPNAVINKPGKLTETEYDLIKSHPDMGSRILAKITEIPKLSVGARWHHEWYDGTGYPDGLAGKDILEEARMIAVADAYDAMTSRRSYRDVFTQEAVIREIKDGMGTQFDPVFAEIMLQMIEEDPDYKMREA